MVDERLIFDIFSAILLFLVAVIGAWLPLRLSGGASADQGGSYKSAYHIGNCLSAGVMLSAAFCHLLADSLDGLAFVGRFPMANFLAALGYLVTLASDQIVQAISDSNHVPVASSPRTRSVHRSNHHKHSLEMAEAGRHHKPYSNNTEHMPLLDSTEVETRNGNSSLALPISSNAGSQGGTLSPAHVTLTQIKARHSVAPDVSGGGTAVERSEPASPAKMSAAGAHAEVMRSSSMRRQLHQTPSSDGAVEDMDDREEHSRLLDRPHSMQYSLGGAVSLDDHGHLDVLLTSAASKLNFATAVLLAAALCVHSVLEGMALGAQKTMRSTQDIMFAIAAHKGLAAYALGSSVVESGADLKRFWTVILIFSSATPVAIFVGYALSAVSSGKGGDALSALASGTFIYVAVMEVIPRELSGAASAAGPKWMRAAKITALMAGFFAMSLLAIWA